MVDFRDLDPEIRCFALVGQFLKVWSVMEDSLDNAIGAALSIETTKLQVLCANLGCGYKIHVLKTLVDVAPNFTSDEKAEFVRKLCKLGEWSGNRNMVAHNVFGPDASKKGVEFSIVKAKGKFDSRKEVWAAA